MVSFINWETCTLIHSSKAHDADVLCLAANSEGNVVFSGGVDRVIVRHKFISSTTSGKKTKWIMSGARRYHSHDIRALALCEARPVNAIISGGVDRTLVVNSPASSFPDCKPHRVSPLPQRPPTQLNASQKLFSMMFNDHVKIWKLGELEGHDINDLMDQTRVEPSERYKLIIELKPKFESYLTAASMSPDATLLAISDAKAIKMFKLDICHETSTYSVSRLPFFNTGHNVSPASSLLFTPDSKRLIIAGQDSKIQVVELDIPNGSYDIVHTFTQHSGFFNGMTDDSDDEIMSIATDDESDEPILAGPVRRTVSFMSVSADGMYLASSDSKDVHVFNLDTLQHQDTLPSFSLHTCIRFNPTRPELVVTCATNEFFIYDVEKKGLTEWSRINSNRLPKRWLERRDPICGIDFNGDTMFLYGYSFLSVVDLTKVNPFSSD